jgi:hypothetical protein
MTNTHRNLAALALTVVATGAMSQLASPNPDWREMDAPPPPALQSGGLVPLDMPPSGLRFFVQPDSVSIGSDGIVRYVVVATSSGGAVNGIYEGLHCDKAMFRTYARHNPDQGWVSVNTQWRPLFDGSNSARHNIVMARTAACIGNGTNTTPAQIIRDLSRPAADRFRQEIR